jgi:UPF0042 nucleotide-binding protein
MAIVEIVSFGYLHGAPPAAHLTVDLRHHFRDPHVSPELRYMSADDEPVRAAVFGTDGIPDLVRAIASAVKAFASGPSGDSVVVAIGCAGGRHRAPTVAREVADVVRSGGPSVIIRHRDLHQPVVQR